MRWMGLNVSIRCRDMLQHLHTDYPMNEARVGDRAAAWTRARWTRRRSGVVEHFGTQSTYSASMTHFHHCINHPHVAMIRGP